MKKLDSTIIKKIVTNNGGFCLSEYRNIRTKMIFKCAVGHIWETKPDNIINANSWCPVCAGNVKYQLENMHSLAKEKNGYCLSTEYINMNSKLLWECEKGHQWKAKPADIKNNNQWCPICRQSKGENKISDLLIKHKIKFERQKKFDNCKGEKNKLPFDFFLSDYKILVEFDGKQHYKVTQFRGCSKEIALKNYQNLIENDKIKNKFAIDFGFKLIRVPYYIKNIEKYIMDEISLL